MSFCQYFKNAILYVEQQFLFEKFCKREILDPKEDLKKNRNLSEIKTLYYKICLTYYIKLYQFVKLFSYNFVRDLTFLFTI